MSLPQLLLNLRQRHGLSQRTLASKLAISNTHVMRWERGDALPTDARLQQIAAVLGVSAQPLLRARRAAVSAL